VLSNHIEQITNAQLNTASLSYKNSIHRVAIEYPSNWVKKEAQNRSSNDIVTLISPSGSEVVNTRGGRPALNISLEQWSGGAIDLLRKSITNFTLVASNSTTLTGLPAREIVLAEHYRHLVMRSKFWKYQLPKTEADSGSQRLSYAKSI